MVCRAQLRFVEPSQNQAPEERSAVHVYVGFDGGPPAVLGDLFGLAEVTFATSSNRGVAVAGSQFIIYRALAALERRVHSETADGERPAFPDFEQLIETEQPSFLLGYAIEPAVPSIRGNESYLYVITPPCEPDANPSEWNVKLSRYRGFPRGDANIDAAFDNADWEYEGSLPAIYDQVVGSS